MLDNGVISLGVMLTAAPAAAPLPCPVLEVGVDPLTPTLVPIVVVPVVPVALFAADPPLPLTLAAGI
jgi:hypothetical protein